MTAQALDVLIYLGAIVLGLGLAFVFGTLHGWIADRAIERTRHEAGSVERIPPTRKGDSVANDTTSRDIGEAERQARNGPDDLDPTPCDGPGCVDGDVQNANGTYAMCPVCYGWGELR